MLNNPETKTVAPFNLENQLFRLPEPIPDTIINISNIIALEVLFQENHWASNMESAGASIDLYDAERGWKEFTPYPFRNFPEQDVVSKQQIEAIRLIAAQAILSGNNEKVVITIFDSDNIPYNDRNSCITIDNGPLNPQVKPHLQLYPKVKTNDPGDHYYDWQPLDTSEKTHLIDKAVQNVEKIVHKQPDKNNALAEYKAKKRALRRVQRQQTKAEIRAKKRADRRSRKEKRLERKSAKLINR